MTSTVNVSVQQIRSGRNRGATVITTTESERFDNGVTDVSIIPYMRHQMIQFAADGLRPNRRVYFYFDDTDITDYIIKPSELTLTQNNDQVVVQAGFSNNDTIAIGSNTATVVQASRFWDFVDATPTNHDDASPRKRRRILRLANTSGQFANAQDFVTSVTANTGTVGAIRVDGGETLNNFFQNTTSNSIQLPISTRWVANNYWGINGANSILLMPRKKKKGRVVRAYIGNGVRGFDNVTQTLYLSNTVSELITIDPELPTDNTDNTIAWTIGDEHRTDFEGKIAGTFSVPAGLFRTGERVFRIIDDPANDPNDATTRADYRFVSSGLKQTKNDVVINNTETTVIPPRPRRPRTGTTGRDPIAQTFFVEESANPNGVFITKVGLYFYNKDEVLPVTIQIRPTVNGYPHSSEVVPNGEVSLSSEYITTSTNATVESVVTFDSPVYLAPGEYALVVKSDSLEYEVFVSELGQKVLGTNRLVSEQPYLGSFFKSQNSSTWDAIQLEDLCFKLYKAKFSTSGTVIFDNFKPSNNAFADIIYSHMEDTKLPNTDIIYAHSYDGGVTYQSYIPDVNFVPNTGRVTFANTTSGQYKLRATLTTNDTSVSPIIYSQAGKLIAIENYIDNANIDADDIVITNAGTGYTPNANITIALTSASGTGAYIYAIANSTGKIDTVYVTDGGYGYTDNVSFYSANNNVGTTIVAANGTGATIAINKETGPFGGPALAKYISRQVTLAEGFEAGDLRVFLTAYKPTGSDIKVYYKVKNPNDTDTFESKNYVLMKQKTLNTLYSSKSDYDSTLELEFEPYDAINAISYSTATSSFSSFNQYAIKIVLTSDDTTKYPVVYDMRAIALPAMST